MSKTLPILFNTEMVRAILDGRKTVTRRIMKPQPMFYTGRKYIFDDSECPKKWEDCDNILRTYQYQPGDILYVRETWCKGSLDYHEERYYYRADNHKFHCQWRPSIHMPREAARIWLKVTDVRVERLQEITVEQVIKEGCADLWIDEARKMRLIDVAGNKNEFTDLWNLCIRPIDLNRYGWDENPWVWVIEFEWCEKPEEG